MVQRTKFQSSFDHAILLQIEQYHLQIVCSMQRLLWAVSEIVSTEIWYLFCLKLNQKQVWLLMPLLGFTA